MGVMTAIWTNDADSDWMNRDDYIWFSLSVALCLVFSEILPLIYTSDWHRMGFLLMAFVNWRDLWLRNQRHALAHDPRLIDDLFESKPNSSALEFKPFTKSKRYHTNYNSLGLNLLASSMSDHDTELPKCSLSFKEPKVVPSKRDAFDLHEVIIDDNLIIPSYVHAKCMPYYTTHRARLHIEHKGMESTELFCLKAFECDAIEKSMLQPIYQNLLKFKNLQHDGLTVVYDVGLKLGDGGSKKLEILSQWYQGGSLFDIIDMSPKDTPFADHVIRRMILQIATFMDWLHRECKIPHGHLKSRNILFDNEMNVCVTDIGLISLKKTMNVLLPNSNFEGYWMDKEYFLGKPIKYECDVWSFGFVLYEIIAKKQPFNGQNIDYIKKCIVNESNMPSLPPHVSPFLGTLIKQCWEVDRSKRPSFHQIVDMIQAEMRGFG
eukprot:125830_1